MCSSAIADTLSDMSLLCGSNTKIYVMIVWTSWNKEHHTIKSIYKFKKMACDEMQYNDVQCQTRLWSVINPWIVPNRFRYQLSSQRTTCWSRTDFQSLLAASEDASFMDGKLRATAPVFPRIGRDCRPRWRPSSTGITPPFGRAMVAEGHFYYFNEARKKKDKSQRKWRVLSGCEKLILKQGKGYHPHNEDDWKLKKRWS